ncbi:glycoside hydrolase family 13 protein [Clostridium pasteurianum]|uniref:Glycosidase n=1 Tax=Clostridium pasteurianum BC1 TaxID=86416 RepID=R4K664_CLOPA|nr:alpha-glucosidase [Clostridium pasteurianum]AGK98682.1 glycosidase [Clostridium pasteurianum BC1]
MNQEKVWWKESVVYQIYPRSFKDSNGDGIGDLRGIIEKLDYLKDLGVTMVWLSPIYKSPNEDNGYDISDYQDIMDDFGTMHDFDELLSEAHKRGIKIIMDLVVNHTSDEHKWFIESKKSIDNPYREYYIWRKSKAGVEPNNWGSWFGGKAWEYDNASDMYYLHIFAKKQPDLNWDNPKVRDEVFSMMTWWLDKGIDGFRMDVISLISKVKELPDGDTHGGLYGDLAPYCIHGPNVHDYLKEMNERVLSKYDIMTVGEATGVTIEEAKKYAGYDSGELDTVFQFEHMDLTNGEHGKWSNKRFSLLELKKVFDKWQKGLKGEAWNCLFWSNHDQPRAVSRFGDDSHQYREVSAKMLGTCLHMLQGTPYVYQGEELGMTNVRFKSIDNYRDIETINTYNENVNNRGLQPEIMMDYIYHVSRDNARTPMQWDDTENAGFTTGTPWIKVNDNYKKINAKAQVNDENSVYNYYKKLISLRKEHEIIIYGDYELLSPEDENIYAYIRSFNNDKLLIICNFSKYIMNFEIPKELKGKEAKMLISNYPEEKLADNISLRPYEARVYKY